MISSGAAKEHIHNLEYFRVDQVHEMPGRKSWPDLSGQSLRDEVPYMRFRVPLDCGVLTEPRAYRASCSTAHLSRRTLLGFLHIPRCPLLCVAYSSKHMRGTTVHEWSELFSYADALWLATDNSQVQSHGNGRFGNQTSATFQPRRWRKCTKPVYMLTEAGIAGQR